MWFCYVMNVLTLGFYWLVKLTIRKALMEAYHLQQDEQVRAGALRQVG